MSVHLLLLIYYKRSACSPRLPTPFPLAPKVVPIPNHLKQDTGLIILPSWVLSSIPAQAMKGQIKTVPNAKHNLRL